MMRTEANGFDIFLALVCYFIYAWCISLFLKKHLQGKRKEAGIFQGLLFCSYGAWAFFGGNTNMPYILQAVCSHIVLTGLLIAIFPGKKEKKLLAAAILSVIRVLIWNFCDSFLCCVWLLLWNFSAGSRPAVSVDVWGERIIIILTYIIGINVINLLSTPLEPVFDEKRKSWYISLTVPLFCIVLIMDFVNWAASNGIMVQDWEKYGLYENQLFSHGGMCIFTGLAMAAAAFFIFGMDRINREEQAREQYQSQVMYYQMMEEEYSRMERLRHDMKNHVIALDNLVQNRQWEKADAYLREMAEVGGIEEGDEITGSLVIDALLYHKRRQAAEHGIRWQCDARLPGNCPIKEMDLCIIVGNALDNAAEACLRLLRSEKEKTPLKTPFIQVYLGTIKQCLFFEVRNSIGSENNPEKNMVKKETPGKHGLGLGNIRAAAASYNGTVHMETDGKVFTLSVLLPLYHQENTYEALRKYL